MEGYSKFPKPLDLLEHHHRVLLESYPGHSLGESYPSAGMLSYILQLQPTGLRLFCVIHRTFVRGWGGLTSLQRCCRYILQLQPTGLILFGVIPRIFLRGELGGHTSQQKCSRRILPAQPTRLKLFCVIPWTHVPVGVLPLCKDAVDVFYSPSRLGFSRKASLNFDLFKFYIH